MAIVKHVSMMERINGGIAFSCSYVKISTGEIREFVGLKKFKSLSSSLTRAQVAHLAKRRIGHAYTSLVPFECQDGTVVELYTRLFIKFNGEDVAL